MTSSNDSGTAEELSEIFTDFLIKQKYQDTPGIFLSDKEKHDVMLAVNEANKVLALERLKAQKTLVDDLVDYMGNLPPWNEEGFQVLTDEDLSKKQDELDKQIKEFERE